MRNAPVDAGASFFVAGGGGVEPPHTDSESAVLPLDEPPTLNGGKYTMFPITRKVSTRQKCDINKARRKTSGLDSAANPTVSSWTVP
jgi:hypothetical protein